MMTLLMINKQLTDFQSKPIIINQNTKIIKTVQMMMTCISMLTMKKKCFYPPLLYYDDDDDELMLLPIKDP